MKGNEKIIEHLNARLAEELTAISQYTVHAGLCRNLGYKRLDEAIRQRAVDEMKHAGKLIARILFLEGIPIVSGLNEMHICTEVPEMHESDKAAEESAIRGYNEGIRLAGEAGDRGTSRLLKAILKDEEGHIDWTEAQLDQIGQMGVQNYLKEQIR